MKPKVFGIGELLWDILPSGARMGGAPANFACHANALGARAGVISRVGDDSLGHRLIASLGELGIPAEGISVDPSYPTGIVEVELAADGQPQFRIGADVAWDHLVADASLLAMMADADAVCFGTLGQRSASSQDAIRRLIEATPPHALRVFDVNLRQSFYSEEIIRQSLKMADILKVSDSELPVLAKILSLPGGERDWIETLAGCFGLKLVVFTRGSAGSVLFDGRRWHEHLGLPTEVRDTIGAGDSFTAAVTVGLLKGWSPEAISSAANEVAAHVCSCQGAVPPMPGHIRQRFHAAPRRLEDSGTGALVPASARG